MGVNPGPCSLAPCTRPKASCAPPATLMPGLPYFAKCRTHTLFTMQDIVVHYGYWRSTYTMSFGLPTKLSPVWILCQIWYLFPRWPVCMDDFVSFEHSRQYKSEHMKRIKGTLGISIPKFRGKMKLGGSLLFVPKRVMWDEFGAQRCFGN